MAVTAAHLAQRAIPTAPIDGPSAWYGPDMARSDEWVYRLTADDIAEIESAVDDVERRGLDIVDIRRDDFPLPTLGSKLVAIQRDLVEGRGFVLIRGVPIEGREIEWSARAYWGLGTWFGDAVSQNGKGHVLGHVTDMGYDVNDPRVRIYTTSARQPYHTDSCDIVGLLCLKPAKSGGQSAIASSVTVFNEMITRRPDLAEVMAQPFYIDRKDEIPEGKAPYYQMPIVHYHTGLLSTIYSRNFIDAAQQRFTDVPRLSQGQLEAMNFFDSLAASDAIRLDMDFAPGDIQFLHNHQILHGRTPYEDHPEPDRKRHLLRLWLSAPNGRSLPAAYAERYGNIEAGTRRGGIWVPGVPPRAPLDVE